MNKGRRFCDFRGGAGQGAALPPNAVLQATAEVLQGVRVSGIIPGKSPRCGKYRYPDKKAALSARNLRLRGGRNRRRNRPENLRAYPCPRCGGWHLTKSV